MLGCGWPPIGISKKGIHGLVNEEFANWKMDENGPLINGLPAYLFFLHGHGFYSELLNYQRVSSHEYLHRYILLLIPQTCGHICNKMYAYAICVISVGSDGVLAWDGVDTGADQICSFPNVATPSGNTHTLTLGKIFRILISTSIQCSVFLQLAICFTS